MPPDRSRHSRPSFDTIRQYSREEINPYDDHRARHQLNAYHAQRRDALQEAPHTIKTLEEILHPSDLSDLGDEHVYSNRQADDSRPRKRVKTTYESHAEAEQSGLRRHYLDGGGMTRLLVEPDLAGRHGIHARTLEEDPSFQSRRYEPLEHDLKSVRSTKRILKQSPVSPHPPDYQRHDHNQMTSAAEKRLSMMSQESTPTPEGRNGYRSVGPYESVSEDKIESQRRRKMRGTSEAPQREQYASTDANISGMHASRHTKKRQLFGQTLGSLLDQSSHDDQSYSRVDVVESRGLGSSRYSENVTAKGKSYANQLAYGQNSRHAVQGGIKNSQAHSSGNRPIPFLEPDSSSGSDSDDEREELREESDTPRNTSFRGLQSREISPFESGNARSRFTRAASRAPSPNGRPDAGPLRLMSVRTSSPELLPDLTTMRPNMRAMIKKARLNVAQRLENPSKPVSGLPLSNAAGEYRMQLDAALLERPSRSLKEAAASDVSNNVCETSSVAADTSGLMPSQQKVKRHENAPHARANLTTCARKASVDISGSHDEFPSVFDPQINNLSDLSSTENSTPPSRTIKANVIEYGRAVRQAYNSTPDSSRQGARANAVSGNANETTINRGASTKDEVNGVREDREPLRNRHEQTSGQKKVNQPVDGLANVAKPTDAKHDQSSQEVKQLQAALAEKEKQLQAMRRREELQNRLDRTAKELEDDRARERERKDCASRPAEVAHATQRKDDYAALPSQVSPAKTLSNKRDGAPRREILSHEERDRLERNKQRRAEFHQQPSMSQSTEKSSSEKTSPTDKTKPILSDKEIGPAVTTKSNKCGQDGKKVKAMEKPSKQSRKAQQAESSPPIKKPIAEAKPKKPPVVKLTPEQLTERKKKARITKALEGVLAQVKPARVVKPAGRSSELMKLAHGDDVASTKDLSDDAVKAISSSRSQPDPSRPQVGGKSMPKPSAENNPEDQTDARFDERQQENYAAAPRRAVGSKPLPKSPPSIVFSRGNHGAAVRPTSSPRPTVSGKTLPKPPQSPATVHEDGNATGQNTGSPRPSAGGKSLAKQRLPTAVVYDDNDAITRTAVSWRPTVGGKSLPKPPPPTEVVPAYIDTDDQTAEDPRPTTGGKSLALLRQVLQADIADTNTIDDPEEDESDAELSDDSSDSGPSTAISSSLSSFSSALTTTSPPTCYYLYRLLRRTYHPSEKSVDLTLSNTPFYTIGGTQSYPTAHAANAAALRKLNLQRFNHCYTPILSALSASTNQETGCMSLSFSTLDDTTTEIKVEQYIRYTSPREDIQHPPSHSETETETTDQRQRLFEIRKRVQRFARDQDPKDPDADVDEDESHSDWVYLFLDQANLEAAKALFYAPDHIDTGDAEARKKDQERLEKRCHGLKADGGLFSDHMRSEKDGEVVVVYVWVAIKILEGPSDMGLDGLGVGEVAGSILNEAGT